MSQSPLFKHLYITKKRPKPAGGWVQRRNAPDIDGEDTAVVPPSNLAIGLLLDWADGKLSSAGLVRHVRNAIRDGRSDPLLLALTRKQLGQHCNAHVMAMVVNSPMMLRMVQSLPRPSRWTHVVSPMTLLQTISRNYPEEYRRRWGADEGRLLQFWTTFYDSPARRSIIATHAHLSSKVPADLTRTLPLAVFEDAGPYAKGQSADCICVSSIISEGDEKVTRVLLATAIKSKDDPLGTEVWDYILAELEKLALTGFLDADGKRWNGMPLVSKADEQQRCDEWGLPDYRGPEPCSDCLCNRTDKPYTDLRENAAWKPTENMALATYRSRIRKVRGKYHPITQSSFMHRNFMILDAMHVFDVHGAAELVYGGILGRLMKRTALGRNIGYRMTRINIHRIQWYKGRPGKPTLPSIRATDVVMKNGWNVLHGQLFKAAIVRHASGFFKHLAYTFLNGRGEFEDHMYKLVSSLDDIYFWMYGSLPGDRGRFLSSSELAGLRKAILEFGWHYQWCRGFSRRVHFMGFEVTPKVHKTQHFAMLAEFMNPARIANWAEESMVGTTCKVWKGSKYGRYKSLVQHRVLTKRCLSLFMRLEGFE